MTQFAYNQEVYAIGEFVTVPPEDDMHALAGKGDFEIIGYVEMNNKPSYQLDMKGIKKAGPWMTSRFVASE